MGGARPAGSVARPRLVVVLLAAATALENGKGQAPPMGWRSWNAFGPNVSQAIVESVADAIAKPRGDSRKSLLDFGFSDVGLDDNWQACGKGIYGGFHDAQGKPLVDSDRFPDMKSMVEFAHDRNLSAGWYLNNCICRENGYKTNAEIRAHYKGDVAAMKEYDFDSVKVDHCGMFNDMQRWTDLFNDTEQLILTENCHWVGMFPYFDAKTGDLWCPFNYYRTSSDIKPDFDSMLSNLQSVAKWAEPPEHPAKPLSRPGCWAYPDMLEVGNMPSFEQSRAHFAAWCVTSAPLILSFNVSNDSLVESVWPLLSNEAMIEVNQQWAGHPGTLIFNQEMNTDDFAKAYAWGVECNKSDPTQKRWKYKVLSGGVSIRFGDDLCVDASVPKPLGLMPCNESSANQVFVASADGRLSGTMPDGAEGCLEILGKIGPVMQLTKCWDGSPKHQRFAMLAGVWADKGDSGDKDFPPRCVSAKSEYPEDLPAHYISWQTWAKPLPGGELAVLVLNREEPALEAKVGLKTLQTKFGDKFPVVEGNPFKVQDLYEHRNLGSFFGSFTTDPIAAGDSRFYVFMPVGECGSLAPLWWALAVGGGFAFAFVCCRAADHAGGAADSRTADDARGGRSLLRGPASGLRKEAAVDDDGEEDEEEADSSDDERGFMRMVSLPVELLQGCGVSAIVAQVVLCTVVWWSAAIFVTVMFKMSARYSLPPFTLTFLVNTTCGIISFLLSSLVFRDAPLPKMTRSEVVQLVGLGIIAGCEFGCLNKSLEGLSVSERTMLQNINVLLIMLTAWLGNLEGLSLLRVLAGLLLAGGGCMQGLDSAGGMSVELTRSGHAGGLNMAGTHLLVHLPELTPAQQEKAASHAKGLFFMLFSMLLTAFKWTLIQFMTQKPSPSSALGRMSKLQLASRVQPITGLVCLGLAAFFERHALCPERLLSSGMLVRMPFISVGITLITISELKIVQLTSAVATAVLMNLHHIPMVLAGVLFFQDVVSITALAGFVLTCSGGITYALARKQDQALQAEDDSDRDVDVE